MSKQLATKLAKLQNALKKLSDCQQEKCAKEYKESKAVTAAIANEIKGVTAKFLANKLSAIAYKKQLNELKLKLQTSAETLATVKCTLDNCHKCFKDAIKEIGSFMSFMCKTHKDQGSCEMYDKVAKFVSKKKYTTEDIRELTQIVMNKV